MRLSWNKGKSAIATSLRKAKRISLQFNDIMIRLYSVREAKVPRKKKTQKL